MSTARVRDHDYIECIRVNEMLNKIVFLNVQIKLRVLSLHGVDNTTLSRMNESRIPQQVAFGELFVGKRHHVTLHLF